MGWSKDKKFWYYGVSLKSQIFKEGLPKKQNIGGIAERGGTWTVCRFKGGLSEKEGGIVFEGEGVDTPMHAMMTKLSPITFAK